MEFSFKNEIQSVTVPHNGLYLLEVWGARGGNSQNSGGRGGHSLGYIHLSTGTTLYIVTGGVGGNSSTSGAVGGYNGGGNAEPSHDQSYETSAGGGGATHIALDPGLLNSFTYETFVTQKRGLIVAGGGGGSSWHLFYNKSGIGGTGGGLTGGTSTGDYGPSQGGTQVNGYSFGQGQTGGGGGGGGLYGGYSAAFSGGGGGSGFIGNLRDWNSDCPAYTENGIWDSNGKAHIKLVN